MRIALAGVVCAALLAGCGGSSPSPSPPPAAPTPPASSPSPSPSPPSTPSSTPGSGTGGGGGGGSAGGGAGDRHATVERLDGNPECDALVPSTIPVPVQFDLGADPGHACGRGTSEGGGHVAVAATLGASSTEWQVLSSDGRREQRMTLDRDVLLPQPEGWQGARADATIQPFNVEVLTFFGDGSARRTATAPSARPLLTADWMLSPDPLGGSLLVQKGVLSSAGMPPCDGEASRFDATGFPRGTAAAVGCIPFAAGVSTLGESLVLENSALHSILHWLRPDGTTAAAPSDEGEAFPIFGSGAIRLEPLLDGALAAASGPDWIRRYPHLAPRGEPPDAFLASRSGKIFRFTRGNRGYAFFAEPGATSADCTQVIELVAPDGRRCATVTLRSGGTGCTTGNVDQGWDGTVVQQLGKNACTYRWWPRLLAAP
jgi:hypothetical protein